MSGPVIIRLQSLPLEARASDIRRFFGSLVIPDGGVHIIGGEKGDAFIAFQSDEDARQAMELNGRVLCGAQIRLYLSSKTEMQNVISMARNMPPAPTPLIKTQTTQEFQTLTQPTGTTTNPVDLLSSLTKLISSTTSASLSIPTTNPITTQASYQLPKATPTPLNLLEQLTKPQQAQPQPQVTASNLPSVIADFLSKSQPAPTPAPIPQPPQPVTTTTSSQININQILSLLQSVAQPAAQPQPVAPAPPQHQPSQIPNTAMITNLLSTISAQSTSTQALQQQQRAQIQPQQTLTTQPKAQYHSVQKYNQSNYQPTDQQQPQQQQQQQDDGYQSHPRYQQQQQQRQQQFQQRMVPGKRPVGNDFQQNDRPFNPKYSRQNYDDAPPQAAGSTGHRQPQLDPIIRVSNFASNCSYKDIRQFLQGIQIEHDGIKLLTDHQGQRTGTAYVKLMTITDLKKALCRNKQFYDTRSIEVVQSNQIEFANFDQPSSRVPMGNRPFQKRFNNEYRSAKSENYEEVQGGVESAPSGDGSATGGFFLKIYGLPARFGRSSLQNEFNNVKFIRMQTIFNQKGQSKLICEVETQLDLERALTRNNEKVGKNVIQVFEITQAEFDSEMLRYKNNSNYNFYQRQKFGGGGMGGATGEPYVPEETYDYGDVDPNELSLLMTGVPFSARDFDVKHFFSGYNLMQMRLLRGECVCLFKSREDRERALAEKNMQMFRTRMVKLRPIPFVEYEELRINGRKWKNFNNGANNPGGNDGSGENNGDDQNEGDDDEQDDDEGDDDEQDDDEGDEADDGDDNENEQDNDNANDDYDNNEQENENNDANGNNSNNGGSNNSNNNGNNMNSGNNRQFAGFDDRRQHNRRGRFGNNNFNGRNNNNNGRQMMGGGFNNNNNGQRGGFNNGKRRINGEGYVDYSFKRAKPANAGINLEELPPLPPELENYGSILLLSNVSTQATREDILALVKEFSPIDDTLKIRHTDYGMPAGDAIVAFNAQDDANNAATQINGSTFMGRIVKAVVYK